MSRVEGLQHIVIFGNPKEYPEGPYTLPMELGTKKTIPILVLGTSFHSGSVCGTLWDSMRSIQAPGVKASGGCLFAGLSALVRLCLRRGQKLGVRD